MTVGVESLVPPHEVGVVDQSVVRVTPSSLIPRVHVIDPQVSPRVLRAVWRDVMRPVVQAIEAHFEQHEHAVLSLSVPDLGQVYCQWQGPPVVTWRNGVVASVTAEFVETYSHPF